MRHRMLFITTLAATLLLAVLVESASARNFSTSSQAFRATFTNFEIEMPFGSTRCQLTLDGSFHARTLAKVTDALIGYIDRPTLGPCAAGSATVLAASLPWHVSYTSFIGTLPQITMIRTKILGMALRLSNTFVTCLGTSTAEAPVVATFFRSAFFRELTAIELTGEQATSCGVNWRHRSTSSSLTLPLSSRKITLTLI